MEALASAGAKLQFQVQQAAFQLLAEADAVRHVADQVASGAGGAAAAAVTERLEFVKVTEAPIAFVCSIALWTLAGFAWAHCRKSDDNVVDCGLMAFSCLATAFGRRKSNPRCRQSFMKIRPCKQLLRGAEQGTKLIGLF